MGGINLLDQLKSKKGSDKLSYSASPSSSPFEFPKGSLKGDNLGVLLRLLTYVFLAYGGYQGIVFYEGEEEAKLRAELAQIQENINVQNQRKSQLKYIGEEMKGYLARVEELEGKINAVVQQETDRSYLIRALEYVALEMPSEIWLAEITTQRLGKTGKGSPGSTATFRGYSMGAQPVSDFIQKLEASVYFPLVTLDKLELVPETTTSSGGAGGKAIPIPPNSRSFQIIAKLGE